MPQCSSPRHPTIPPTRASLLSSRTCWRRWDLSLPTILLSWKMCSYDFFFFLCRKTTLLCITCHSIHLRWEIWVFLLFPPLPLLLRLPQTILEFRKAALKSCGFSALDVMAGECRLRIASENDDLGPPREFVFSFQKEKDLEFSNVQHSSFLQLLTTASWWKAASMFAAGNPTWFWREGLPFRQTTWENVSGLSQLVVPNFRFLLLKIQILHATI